MDLTTVRKILVIKLRYIGDVLLSTPVIANLRRHFPEAQIIMVVNKGTDEVLRYNPHLNEVLPLDRSRIKGWGMGRVLDSLSLIKRIRRERFDLVVDLTDGDRGAIMGFLSGAPIRIGYNAEGRIRGRLYTTIVRPSQPRLHNVEYQLEAIRTLGLPVVTKRLDLRWGESERRFAEEWLIEKGWAERSFATVHPGARWWFKQWPLDRFATLAERLWEQHRLETLFLGGEKERGDLLEIRRHGRRPFHSAEGITLLQLAALIEKSRLFIGNDNGPMHIAAAVGTPAVALFGSSDPKIWGPWGEGHEILYMGVSCSPCAHIGCEMGELNCMRQISLSAIMSAVDRVLRKEGNALQSPLAYL